MSEEMSSSNDLDETRVIPPEEPKRMDLDLGEVENRIVNTTEYDGGSFGSIDRTQVAHIARNNNGENPNGNLTIGGRLLRAMKNLNGEQNTGNVKKNGADLVLANEDVGRAERAENEEDMNDKMEEEGVGGFEFDDGAGSEKGDEVMVKKGNRRRRPFMEKTTKRIHVGEISKRKRKEQVRVEIMKVLLNAGWQIGVKQRKGKGYQEEVVYLTPKEKTYRSIISAYECLKLHCEAGDGIGKFYLRGFKFKPLAHDEIKVLCEAESKKRRRKDGSTPKGGTKSEDVNKQGRKKAREAKEDESKCRYYHFIDVSGEDRNDDTCLLCGDGGDLICCDGCPSAFHLSCLKIDKLPSDDWYCTYCRCKFCGLVGGSSQKTQTSDDYTASMSLTCCLCEHRYHRSCSEKNGIRIDHSSDACFCGNRCRELFERLQRLLGVKHEIGHGFSWTFISRSDVGSKAPHLVDCNSKLVAALSIMQESFEPQIDHRSGINMIHNVLYSYGSNFNRLNYKRFFTAILETGDEVICVASLRVHENNVAEMPLIATRRGYRRQGMCRRFLTAIETALSSLAVELLVLPSVPQLTKTWTTAFGFEPIDLETKNRIENMKLFVFSDATMLKKKIQNNDSFVEEHDDLVSAEVPNLGMNQHELLEEPNNSNDGGVSGWNISEGSLPPNENHDVVLFPGSTSPVADGAPNQEDDISCHSGHHLNISDDEAYIPSNAYDEVGNIFYHKANIPPNDHDEAGDISGHEAIPSNAYDEAGYVSDSDHEANIPSNAYDEAGNVSGYEAATPSNANDEADYTSDSDHEANVPSNAHDEAGDMSDHEANIPPNAYDEVGNIFYHEVIPSNAHDKVDNIFYHEANIPSNAYDKAAYISDHEAAIPSDARDEAGNSKRPVGSIMNNEYDGVIRKKVGKENQDNLERHDEVNDKELESVISNTIERLNSVSGMNVEEKRQGVTVPPVSTEDAENSARKEGQNVFLMALSMLMNKSFQVSSEVDQAAPRNAPPMRRQNTALALDLNYAPASSGGADDEGTVPSNQGS